MKNDWEGVVSLCLRLVINTYLNAVSSVFWSAAKWSAEQTIIWRRKLAFLIMESTTLQKSEEVEEIYRQPELLKVLERSELQG